MFNPPEFLRSIGWQGYLVLPSLFLLLLFFFLPGYAFVRSVFKKCELIPLGKQIERRDIRALMDTLGSLGFIQAGQALELPIFAAIIVPFVREDVATYCMIIRTQVGFGRTTFAFSSVFDEDSGGLATFREHTSAIEPGPAGSFRQVFPKDDMQSIFEHHLRGLQYLQKYGFNVRAVGRDTFVEDEKRAITLRKKFLSSNLVRHTLIFIWRFLIRRSPYGGPVERQKIAQKSLRKLQREPVAATDTKTDLRSKIIADIEKMRRQIHTTPRHSGFGIAAFMISMVIIGFVFFMLFLTVILAVIAPDSTQIQSAVIGFLSMCLMLLSLTSIVGLGLGVAGIRQINRKKVFSVLGLVFNLMIIAGMIMLMVIGKLVP